MKSTATFMKPLRPGFRPPRPPRGYNFVPGKKEVFLPKFTLTLLRTPFLSPKWAQFIVPLNFNKLDLRDYLFHAYNVSVHSVRSYIQFQPIQRRPASHPHNIIGRRAKYRPKGIKKMTVELVKPFVWPDAPTDLEPWEKAKYDSLLSEGMDQNSAAIEAAKKKEHERAINQEATPDSEIMRMPRRNPRSVPPPPGETRVIEQRKELRKKAQEILEGLAKKGEAPSAPESGAAL